jgi:energy-coupling factor transporter ATP-binding protein EcfA2
MVTRRSGEADAERAQRFSVLLGQMGLGAIEHENTKNLSRFRRVMVLLLAAALNSEVGCILLNDPLLEMPQEDGLVARRVFAFLKDAGKGVMLAGCDSALMASVANRVLALRDGRVVFDDTFRRFIDRNCLGIFSFTSAEPDAAVSYFVEKHPEVSALSNGNLVYLMRRRDDDIQLEKLIKGALTHGADPHSLVLDEKSFDIACREVLKGI